MLFKCTIIPSKDPDMCTWHVGYIMSMLLSTEPVFTFICICVLCTQDCERSASECGHMPTVMSKTSMVAAICRCFTNRTAARVFFHLRFSWCFGPNPALTFGPSMFASQRFVWIVSNNLCCRSRFTLTWDVRDLFLIEGFVWIAVFDLKVTYAEGCTWVSMQGLRHMVACNQRSISRCDLSQMSRPWKTSLF